MRLYAPSIPQPFYSCQHGFSRQIFSRTTATGIHNSPFPANTSTEETAKDAHKGESIMKATGIVRRVDDLGRIVIPKEIRRTLRIREGDPLQTSLTQWEKYCFSMLDLAKRRGW